MNGHFKQKGADTHIEVMKTKGEYSEEMSIKESSGHGLQESVYFLYFFFCCRTHIGDQLFDLSFFHPLLPIAWKLKRKKTRVSIKK